MKKIESPSFYNYYPKLFSKYFINVTEEKIAKLSRAGYYYYYSLLKTDALIDDGRIDKLSEILKLQEESIKILSWLFKNDSNFWKLWNKRKNEYFEAVEIEKKTSIHNFNSFKIYEDLADKKSAFGKVAIDAMYTLNNDSNDLVYKKLLDSHKHFSIGFQLYDDLKDFSEDYKKGQFNYTIYKLNLVIDFKHYNHNVDILNKLVYLKGISAEVLYESIKQFDLALSILNQIKKNSGWHRTTTRMKETIENYLKISNGYLATIYTKQKIKYSKQKQNSFFDYSKIQDKTIKKGLDFIQNDYTQNYVELKHIMFLGGIEGFKNKTSIHISDTFQRAILNDCLQTIINHFKLNENDFFRKEINYLVERRNKGTIGGWSYFPTVKEIAADIDDLGQIIQLFTITKNTIFIEKYCRKAIDVSLNERMVSSGGIETWIIPKNDQTPIQKIQEEFNSTKWGKGPDVEVVANYMYALHLFDRKKYKDYINSSILYIISQQSKYGFWESRWYYGLYYGTYVCLRLLKKNKKEYTIQIENALLFLIKKQNPDGGFSMGKENSDPLSTALVILSLKLFYPNKHKTITLAEKYLVLTQNKDGSWNEVNFIKPKASEPYKSKTISTAYALKSLCSNE